jgi:glycosyltransferase involved in cell wall biosynthesis
MVLGRLIHHRFGIPYVIDYIDPWISEYYWKLPKSQRPPKWAMAYALSRLLEPPSIKQVSHIVGVSRGVLDKVIARYPKLTEANTTEIPYGCEPSDFEHVLKYAQQNRIFDPHDGLLHISYVGACTVGMQTTVKALFDSVRIGLARAPETFNQLRLHFVGTSYSRNGELKYQVLKLAQEAGIEKLVDEHPDRVSYLEALQLLVDSNGLVILGYDEPHYAASKVYPYMFAGKPLIAILHEASSPVEILRRASAAQIITFGPQRPLRGKVEEISQKLGKILSSPGERDSLVNAELVDSFTTRSMTARLCRCFDSVMLKKQAATALAASVAD